MAQLLDAVARLPKDSIVLFVSLLRDGTGRLFTNPKRYRSSPEPRTSPSTAGRRPTSVMASWGPSRKLRGPGAKAAELGLRILGESRRGTCPSSTARAPRTSSTSASFAAGASARIDSPHGSIVRYQDPSLWSLYRGYVAGGTLALGVISLMWGLLLQRAGRRRVELSLDERLKFESLLSELSASLIHISLNDLDEEIGRGLRQIGEFLKVDQGQPPRVRGGRGHRSNLVGRGRGGAAVTRHGGLVSSLGRPSSFGKDTSSGSPAWTSFPSTPRSTGEAIRKAARSLTCRPARRRRHPPRRACPSTAVRAREDVA